MNCILASEEEDHIKPYVCLCRMQFTMSYPGLLPQTERGVAVYPHTREKQNPINMEIQVPPDKVIQVPPDKVPPDKVPIITELI